MAALDVLVGALFGAALGSFLGCAAYRLPHRISMNGRSHCPTCGTKLRWYWNIPVASWLTLRGRSVCCDTRISPSYLAYEIASCLLGAAAGLLLGLYVVLGVVVGIMLIVASVDRLRTRT